jgi:hypothetical protein
MITDNVHEIVVDIRGFANGHNSLEKEKDG